MPAAPAIAMGIIRLVASDIGSLSYNWQALGPI
jgi:hypothetical protein